MQSVTEEINKILIVWQETLHAVLNKTLNYMTI